MLYEVITHGVEVLVVDAAEGFEPPTLALRQQLEIVDQGLHRRIEPVPLGELQGKA